MQRSRVRLPSAPLFYFSNVVTIASKTKHSKKKLELARAAYVHVPFCRHRCGYCNFTLLAGRDDLVVGYLRAIAFELVGTNEPTEVDTLYFGGGTPTHLEPD